MDTETNTPVCEKEYDIHVDLPILISMYVYHIYRTVYSMKVDEVNSSYCEIMLSSIKWGKGKLKWRRFEPHSYGSTCQWGSTTCL